ncbi:12208_t:CDS:2, partial [Racocetra fulgida]
MFSKFSPETTKGQNQDVYLADKLEYFENLVIYNAIKQLALQKDSRINKPADVNEK